jgi:hypothetical protein
MKTLESPVGQQATNLADALHRGVLPDGRPQLEALHREGMIKKIPSNQVIVTPNAQSNVKLDELNRIIKEMETGEAAINRLREIDKSTGLVDPAVKRKAEAEFKRHQERKTQQPEPLLASTDGALDDKSLAMNMLALDPETVIIDAAQTELINILKSKGIDSIPLTLSHSRTLGGGFHCVTLDTRRRHG